MKLRNAGALLLACISLASCGTRLPNSAFESQATQRVAATNDDTSGDADGELVIDNTTDTTSRSGDTDGETGALSNDTRDNTTDSDVRAADDGPNKASDIGVTADTITLGNITAENGVLGDAFAPAVRGIRAWVAHTNARGGIHGRKIILKTCDDREDRARNLACAQQLVERDKVFALVGTNTRTLGGSSQYLNDKGVPVIGFQITNGFYRYPHFWSSYPQGYARDGKTVGYKGQVMFDSGLARWFKETQNVTKAAVFEYDVNESKQAGDAYAQGMRLEGYADVQVYVVSFAAPSFDQAVADMQRRGTQMIFDTMDDGANRKLCDAMQRRNFTVKAKVSTVVSQGEAVGTSYPDVCRNSVFIPGSSKPYTDTSVAEIKAFRTAYERYQPGLPVHQWALEAWALANMVGEAIDTSAPTRDGLEMFLRGLNKYKARGIFTGLDWRPVDYSQPTVESCFTVNRWLDSKGGWTEAVSKFPFCYPDAKNYGAPALDQGN